MGHRNEARREQASAGEVYDRHWTADLGSSVRCSSVLLALLLLAVLHPPRVRADRLVSVRCRDGVAQRLVLRVGRETAERVLRTSGLE
ncbi:hypothetical protein [Streptomyces sp. NPDC001536]|uniref:hypothetical protein n=1 Tax=Streptomyces sp. NPDC001536 TaxID=3364583 RepID=UPI00369AC531